MSILKAEVRSLKVEAGRQRAKGEGQEEAESGVKASEG